VRKVHKSKKHDLRISIGVALNVLLSVHISDSFFSNRLRLIKREGAKVNMITCTTLTK
jgi:hypothetical protein